jgi:hypothetical protein
MTTTTREGKVLPFATKQGNVLGHAIVAHYYNWMDRDGFGGGKYENPIESVAFKTFDRELNMPLSVVVHWTRWTEFSKKMHDAGRGYEVTGVILKDGRMLHAEGRYASYGDSQSYMAAPLVARDLISIVTLSGGSTLLSIAGVSAFLRSQRRAEDAALIVDPWARDNAAFNARHPKLAV